MRKKFTEPLDALISLEREMRRGLQDKLAAITKAVGPKMLLDAAMTSKAVV
jgi:hypothetical protein